MSGKAQLKIFRNTRRWRYRSLNTVKGAFRQKFRYRNLMLRRNPMDSRLK